MASTLVALAALALASGAFQELRVPGDSPCTLRGVLVDDAGKPLAGVNLRVRGHAANSDRVRQFGAPKDWQDPAPVASDAEGRFELVFVPPRAFQFALDAEPPGHGRLAWRWPSIAPGATLELGAAVVEPEALLVGHIVDAAGNLLIDGWSVSARHDARHAGEGRTSTWARAAVDPTTGQFRITGLAPGELRVSASSGSVRVPEVVATTRGGVETAIELRYEGPDPRTKLVVTLSTTRYHIFEPAPGTVLALAADGTPITLEPEPGRANDWFAPDVAPGAYRIEVRDPRFLPWSKDGVSPGQPARAFLEGNAGLRVRVVDDETGARVEDFALDVEYPAAGVWPNVFRVREPGGAAPPEDHYRGVVPGDLVVAVQAAGWPARRVAVPGLAPGELRELEVRLARSATLVGRVVDTAGRPLAGVVVQATRGDVPGHDRGGPGPVQFSSNSNGTTRASAIPYRDAATTTDSDGRFTFDDLGKGMHTLLAERGRFVEAVARVALPTSEPVTLVADETRLVSVRLLLPEGVDGSRLTLTLPARNLGEDGLHRLWRRNPASAHWRAEATGVFPAEALGVGAHSFVLSCVVAQRSSSTHIPLMDLDVAVARDGEVEFDLRERYPVEVVLRPDYGSDAGSRPLAVAWALVAAGRARSNFTEAGASDTGAPALVAFVAPGTYDLQAAGPAFEWTRPEPVVVARGAAPVLLQETALVARPVRILRADGQPDPRARFAYWSALGTRGVVEADETGAAALILPEGDVSFARLPPPPPPVDEDDAFFRRAGLLPPVAPEVLAALVAGATLHVEPSDSALAVRLPAPPISPAPPPRRP